MRTDTGHAAGITRRAALMGLGAGLLLESTPAPSAPVARAAALAAAARRQVGVTLAYDPGYTALAFPNGDVPRGRGVCTDVVVRAYRDAFGLDLQALVNADMRRHFGAYPKLWGLARPDRSIDHRRVPNLATFLTRAGARLPLPASRGAWRPGDLFTAMIGGRLPHIGIVSDRGPGVVIHNIGRGTREEAALFDHSLTGRFRWLDG